MATLKKGVIGWKFGIAHRYNAAHIPTGNEFLTLSIS